LNIKNNVTLFGICEIVKGVQVKVKSKSRRNFLKTAAACCVMSQFVPSISSGEENKSDFSLDFFEESDFIVVNGWVLLKSDLALS